MVSFWVLGGGSVGYIRLYILLMKGLFMVGFKVVMKFVWFEEDDIWEWRRSGGCEVGSFMLLDL